MIPICYTASSVFWFQTEEEKFYEHFDDDKLEEVSKINDDYLEKKEFLIVSKSICGQVIRFE